MRIPIILAILFYSSSVWAVDNVNSAWLGTFAKKEITEKYFGWIEAQMRYGLDAGGTNQILYRTGVLRKIGENHEIGFLYAYIQGGSNKEHRWTLQHVQNYGRFLDLKFSHRARLEARFLEDDDDDAGRFRYLIRAEGETKPSPAIVIWNEIFLNTTRDSWTRDRLDDRNRFFIGAKMKIGNIRGEFGYLNQYVPRRTESVSEHIATFYFFF
ncbi:MAG: DUF2490 domain-containing protein [Pseudomonadota bacterium]